MESGVGVTSTRTRILAPCILGHDSLVPSLISQSGNETTATNSWKFARIRPLQLRTFRCTMHYFSLLSLFEWRLEVFRPFVVVISPKFCGWHTDWQTGKLTDRTDYLTPLRACARGVIILHSLAGTRCKFISLPDTTVGVCSWRLPIVHPPWLWLLSCTWTVVTCPLDHYKY